MTTQVDYALMAGGSYISNRSDINRFPSPQNWVEKVETRARYDSSGFEATSFQRGDEIVISFAGTNPNEILLFSPDWVYGNTPLATGLSCAIQLKEAAAYYLEIRNNNQNAQITLTGHSLGGGLAALLGVFLNVNAVTFDQAPFANSAKESIRDGLIEYLHGQEYTDAQLNALAPELMSFTNGSLAARQEKVNGYFVQGEVLSTLPFSVIGHQEPITHGGAPDSLFMKIDLHSMNLLTAFMQSDQAAGSGETLREVSRRLPELIKELLDQQLYSYPASDPEHRDFLTNLIRHQEGLDPTVPDDGDNMVARFVSDLWKIAQPGGLTMNSNIADAPNALTHALTAFAMQAYYDNRLAPGETLFQDVDGGGGIHFDMSKAADTLAAAKGYTGTDMYGMFTAYLRNLWGDQKTALMQQLPNLRDWYIQAGFQAMTATAGDQRAFMLGGSGGDSLTGGGDADVLVGNMGHDTLNGGAGDDVLLVGWGRDGLSDNTGDTLMGGAGQDTLHGGFGADLLQGGEGADTYYAGANDTINDSGHDGVLYYNGQNVAGMAFTFLAEEAGGVEYHRDETAGLTVRYDPVNHTLTGTGGFVTIENFNKGDFGINLAAAQPEPVQDWTLTGTEYRDEMSIFNVGTDPVGWRLWYTSFPPGVTENTPFFEQHLTAVAPPFADHRRRVRRLPVRVQPP